MFSCDKCGLCCQSLAGVALFRHLDRGDGVCKHYESDTHLCSIYESRPLLCRVAESYDAFFSTYLPREEYDRMNYESCEYLKKRYADT